MIQSLSDTAQETLVAAPELPSVAAAQLGAILVLSGVAITPLVTLLVSSIFPGRNVVFARWGFSHVFQVLLAVLACAFAASLVLGDETDILSTLVGSAFALGAGVAVAIVTAVRVDPESWRALGLWAGRHLRAIVAGLSAYALLLPALLGVALVWAWFLERVGYGYEPQAVAQELAALPRESLLVPALLGVVVMPLFEETLFRGFLQPLLVQNFREKLGIAVTSVFFAALHGTGAFLPIFALSLLLGAVMLRTQRLTAVFAIHALHNGLQFAALWYAPDLVGEGKPAVLAFLGLFA